MFNVYSFICLFISLRFDALTGAYLMLCCLIRTISLRSLRTLRLIKQIECFFDLPLNPLALSTFNKFILS